MFNITGPTQAPLSRILAARGISAVPLPWLLLAAALTRARSARLMAAIDALNQIYGRNTLRTGVCGTAPRWGMKSSNRSACFTTRWDELPQVR